MTWVKVCGLTRPADVAAAVDGGADAVGFVNIEASPRYVTSSEIRDLARGVPVTTVLLSIDSTPDRLLELVEETGVSGVQVYGLHAVEAAEAAIAAGLFVLSPVHAAPDLDLASLPGRPLLDTPSSTKLGGTGKTFDWSVAAGLAGDFVLAGGLGPANVAEAIRAVHPWGVDASSGLELSPGVKGEGMVADFITRAKNET